MTFEPLGMKAPLLQGRRYHWQQSWNFTFLMNLIRFLFFLFFLFQWPLGFFKSFPVNTSQLSYQPFKRLN